MDLNIANIEPVTCVEGPGKRYAIWVQGCLKTCKNCCNTGMQEIKPVIINSVDNIFDDIKYYKKTDKITGITIVGGEPFLQAKGLAELAKKCREIDLSVIVFTGYTLTELQKNSFEATNELLNNIDVLIDGEYNERMIDNKRNWIGSENQKIYFFSDKYNLDIFKKQVDTEIEIRISDNYIKINGEPINIK